MKEIQASLVSLLIVITWGFTGCKTSSTPINTTTATNHSRKAPSQRVDIRGNVLMSRYEQGPVRLETEGVFSENTRYSRAYVLVLPTTQMVGPNGTSIRLSELRQGQEVAVLLRAGDKENLVGVGVARRLWVE